MGEDPSYQDRDQENGEDCHLQFGGTGEARGGQAKPFGGQTGEVQKHRAEQHHSAREAQPLEPRQLVLLHHAVKLQQADYVEQHHQRTNQHNRKCATAEQPVKNNTE